MTPTARLRATVADIAYDEFVVGAGAATPISALVSGINAAGVTIDGRRLPTTEAWSRLFAGSISGIGPVTLVHPSTWGRRRTDILQGAAHAHCTDLQLVPRAVAIARSHLDAAVQCVMVIEVHDRIDVHELRASAQGLQIASTRVVTDPGRLAALLRSVVDNRVEAILIDGRDRDAVAAACRSAEESTIVGRVVAVDRSLLGRYAGAELLPARFDDNSPSATGPGRGRAGATVAVVLALVAAVILGVYVVRDRAAPTSTAQMDRTVELGRVSVIVPGGWRQSSEPPADGVVSRTTFAAPGDDSRLIVLQNTVRDTSTLASVGVSLRNRIDQRGDAVVQEFSASTRYADREVISYREVPVSGGAIRWYLIVDRGLQVSVGCQNGSGGQSVDRQCRTAVGSVRLGPG